MKSLALVMIVRNESRCLARCLASACALVDRMIVVDTGSTDDTAGIAASHGAAVHHFAWCDDFSAARNAALDHSDCDWNLLLDADEWIAAADIAALRAALEATPPFIGLVRLTNQLESPQGLSTQSHVWLPRVLPAGVRYAGAIHEQPATALPQRELPLQLEHDGYLAAQRAVKAGRNLALLQRALDSQPDDAYLLFQLGREYQTAGRPAEALAPLLKSYRLSAPTVPYRHGLVIRLIQTQKDAGQTADAFELYVSEMKNWEHSPDLHFALGDLMMEMACRDPSRALADFLPIARNAYLRCLELGDRPDLHDALQGTGSHLATHNLALLDQLTSGRLENTAG